MISSKDYPYCFFVCIQFAQIGYLEINKDVLSIHPFQDGNGHHHQ